MRPARAVVALLVLAGCSRDPPVPAPGSSSIGQASFVPSRGAVAAPASASASQADLALPDAAPVPTRVPAQPMSHLGASWLERADRERTQQPEKLLDALHLRATDTVADVGAGTGYFSLRLARRVARVLATDIQPEMLSLLRANAARAHAPHIDTILATDADAKLPDDAVDVALMVDVYHELSHPAATLAQVRRSLKSDGRLVLVEYRAEDPKVEIKPEHKMTAAQVRAEVEPNGYRLAEQLELLPEQHVFVFVKDQ